MKDIINKILEGYTLTKEEALHIYQSWESNALFDAANKVREHYMGKKSGSLYHHECKIR